VKRLALSIGIGAAALAAAAVAEPRCPAESSQFDFWIGSWNVEETGAPGRTVASSREEKIAGNCALLENYDEPDGYSGKSVNFWDAVLKKWRQTWTDSAGNVSEFEGSLRDGAIRFEGESHTASGKRVYRRLTFTPLPDGSVRQASEASPDGRTWKVNYDYRYVRRKSAS
jgi:hypothetical protein